MNHGGVCRTAPATPGLLKRGGWPHREDPFEKGSFSYLPLPAAVEYSVSSCSMSSWASSGSSSSCRIPSRLPNCPLSACPSSSGQGLSSEHRRSSFSDRRKCYFSSYRRRYSSFFRCLPRSSLPPRPPRLFYRRNSFSFQESSIFCRRKCLFS